MSEETGKDKGDGFVEVEGSPVASSRRRAKPPAPAPRPHTQHLPGMEPVVVPAVHKAIEEYVVARDQRMELTKIEVQKKAILMEAMKQAGLPKYSVDGHEAEIEVDEQVKARLREPEEEDAEPVGTFAEPAKNEAAAAATAPASGRRRKKGGAADEARA